MPITQEGEERGDGKRAFAEEDGGLRGCQVGVGKIGVGS